MVKGASTISFLLEVVEEKSFSFLRSENFFVLFFITNLQLNVGQNVHTQFHGSSLFTHCLEKVFKNKQLT